MFVCSNCLQEFSKNMKVRSIPVAPFYNKLLDIPTISALIALGGSASCDDCLRGAAIRLARDTLVGTRSAPHKDVVDDGYIDLLGD